MSLVRPELHCACEHLRRQEVLRFEAAPEGETKFDLKGAVYQRAYDQCLTCGHWFARHELDLSQLYNRDYVNATYGGIEGMVRRLNKILSLPPEQSDNAGRVQRILQRVNLGNSSPRVLDVGAGIGVFPAAMKQAGWSVCALEPDPRTAAHLRDTVGVDAISGLLQDQSVAELGTFDLITFNKVLEHIEAPTLVLREAGRFPKRGGLIYIEVPDVAAHEEGAAREEFFVEHHHVFSPISLALMVEAAGLVLEHVSRLRDPSGKYTLIAWASQRGT